MPQSQNFLLDPNKTIGNFMTPQKSNPNHEKPIPKMKDIGNQQIPKKLIDKLLKDDTKKQRKTKLSNPNPVSPLSKLSQSSIAVHKEDAMIKITNYQNSRRFGPSLKKDLKISYTREQMNKKSVDQLEAILYRIRTYLNARHMEGVYEQMVRTTASGYENIVTSFGYDITGFSELIQNNPAFWDAFEMWKLERKLPDIPPSLQLMYIISSTTVIAHLQNKYQAPSKPDRTDKKKDKEEKIKKVKKSQKLEKEKQREKTKLEVGTIV